MFAKSFLAPIDEYSDLPFRLLCQKHGAEATCVPLVSSTAIVRNPKVLGRIDAHSDEKKSGIQLVGSESKEIGQATSMVLSTFPHITYLNLNCGCPSQRTTESGSGSAMLATPQKIEAAVKEMKKNSNVPVSVKLRLYGSKTMQICKSIEEAGADFVILHGRSPGQGYSGKANWNAIKQVKEQLGIPVIGNGDINVDDGEQRIKGKFCDGYMIGRAAMTNPLVFCNKIPEGRKEKLALLSDYIELHRKYLGEPELKTTKIKALQFICGVVHASEARNKIARAKSTEEIIEAFTEK